MPQCIERIGHTFCGYGRQNIEVIVKQFLHFLKTIYLIIRAIERQKEPQWEALDFFSPEGFKQRLNNQPFVGNIITLCTFSKL